MMGDFAPVAGRRVVSTAEVGRVEEIAGSACPSEPVRTGAACGTK